MALFLIHHFGLAWQPAMIVLLALANAIYQGLRFSAAVEGRYGTAFHPAVVVSMIAAIFVAMALVATHTTTRLGRPWFAVAGALTYPLYLLHAYNGFIVIGWLHAIPKAILVPGLIVAMCLVAYSLHVAVERSLARRLKSLLDRIPGIRIPLFRPPLG